MTDFSGKAVFYPPSQNCITEQGRCVLVRANATKTLHTVGCGTACIDGCIGKVAISGQFCLYCPIRVSRVFLAILGNLSYSYWLYQGLNVAVDEGRRNTPLFTVIVTLLVSVRESESSGSYRRAEWCSNLKLPSDPCCVFRDDCYSWDRSSGWLTEIMVNSV